MSIHDTAELIRRAVRDAKIPAGSSYRTPSVLLGIANDQMDELIVPELLRCSGNHLMTYADLEIVGGQSRYRFPDRCIRPERLQVVDSSGKLLSKVHLAGGDLVDEVLAGRCPPGDAQGYWVQENNHAVVVLRYRPSEGQVLENRLLRIYYRRRPNRLVDTEECWRVVSINGPTLDLLPINDGEGDHAAVAGEFYDIITRRPGFEALYEDIEQANDAGNNVLECGSFEPVNAAVGDFVAPAGFTPVPQIPIELHGVLVGYVVAQILREMGNHLGADRKLTDTDKKLQAALTTIAPRSEEAETVVNDAWGV